MLKNYKNIAFIVLAILILIARKPDCLSNPQLWAEDGPVFFAQQYELGAGAIFIDYANYLHIVPRLIALLADTFFSYANIPAVYNYTSLFITIIVIAHCFSPRLQLPLKPLLALSIVLVPQSLNEVFLNITNLQWILCILLLLSLLKDAPNKKYGNYTLQVISDITIITFAGLTGPFLILMFPFFAWKFYNIKTTYGYTLLFITSCGVLIQLFSMAPIIENVGESNIFNLELYISMMGRKLFGGLFFGSSMMYSNSLFIGISTVAFFSTLLYLSYKKSPEDKRVFKTVFVILTISAAILGAVIMKYRFSPEIMAMPSGCRYYYVPYVMVAWSLILSLSQRELWKNIFMISSLLLILYSSVSSGIQTRFIDHNWKYYSTLIGTKPVVTIPINPNWYMTLHTKKK
ncbi:MAG: hypothetical protein V1799_19970 [bacterium]